MSSNGAATESLLIITGTMGAGKTSVPAEASDILTLRHLSHAAIDVDALGVAHLPSGVEQDGVIYRNLESVCKNYAALGVHQFMVARAIERRAELELVLGMQQRVREPGVLQAKYVARVAKLDAILDGARLEDFTVANESRSLGEVAHEVLFKAGWIPD